MTLFKDVNLLSVGAPIIINKYLPVFIGKVMRNVPVQIANTVKTNRYFNISLNNLSQFVCSTSYFLTESECTKIPLETFSVNVKTWNIEQYIYVLPSYRFGDINSLCFETLKKRFKFLERTMFGFIMCQIQEWKLNFNMRVK